MLQFIVLLAFGFVSVTIAAPLLTLPLMPLAVRLRGGSRGLIYSFISSAASMAVAMLLFAWISRTFGAEPSVWPFLLPWLAVLMNNLGRVRRARSGATPVRLMLEARGEAYDASYQLALERVMTLGDSVGLWGAFILLQTLLAP